MHFERDSYSKKTYMSAEEEREKEKRNLPCASPVSWLSPLIVSTRICNRLLLQHLRLVAASRKTRWTLRPRTRVHTSACFLGLRRARAPCPSNTAPSTTRKECAHKEMPNCSNLGSLLVRTRLERTPLEVRCMCEKEQIHFKHMVICQSDQQGFTIFCDSSCWSYACRQSKVVRLFLLLDKCPGGCPVLKPPDMQTTLHLKLCARTGIRMARIGNPVLACGCRRRAAFGMTADSALPSSQAFHQAISSSCRKVSNGRAYICCLFLEKCRGKGSIMSAMLSMSF